MYILSRLTLVIYKILGAAFFMTALAVIASGQCQNQKCVPNSVTGCDNCIQGVEGTSCNWCQYDSGGAPGCQSCVTQRCPSCDLPNWGVPQPPSQRCDPLLDLDCECDATGCHKVRPPVLTDNKSRWTDGVQIVQYASARCNVTARSNKKLFAI